MNKSNEKYLDNYEEDVFIEVELIPLVELTYKKSTTFGSYICELLSNEANPPTLYIKGSFIEPLTIGRSYKASGRVTVCSWNNEKQLDVEEIKKIYPHGERPIIQFLTSLPYMRFQAEIIYSVFGEESINTIREDPQKLIDLFPTVSEDVIYGWRNEVISISDNFHVLMQLRQLGISSVSAKRLYDKYGALVISQIENDPYILSKEIRGYGFRKCDSIARKIGIDINNQSRLCEGIMYYLYQNEQSGSTCVDKQSFIETVKRELAYRLTIPEMKKICRLNTANASVKYGDESYTVSVAAVRADIEKYQNAWGAVNKDACRTVILSIDKKALADAFNALILSGRVAENAFYYAIGSTYRQEERISDFLNFFENAKEDFNVDCGSQIAKYCNDESIALEDKQREAVEKIASCHGGCFAIVGAAGCGKTFTIKTALKIAANNYDSFNYYFNPIIMAPTGKASEVASKATGLNAGTIHKVLEMGSDGNFKYNVSNPLPYTCVVVDESSMLDTNLAYSLLSAIHPSTKLILLGDPNQISSIGPGNILSDIINSKKVTVVTLDVVKRQSGENGSLINSRLIMAGKSPTSQREKRDSLVLRAKTDDEYEATILKKYRQFTSTFGYTNVQVLSSQRTGIMGTNYLNYVLQKTVNSNTSDNRNSILSQQCEIIKSGVPFKFDLYFHVGDKVINTQNDYSAVWYTQKNNKLCSMDGQGVFNGETGMIVFLSAGIDVDGSPTGRIVVKFADKYIIYTDNFDSLELSYALTIHKSQGSEWAAGIIPVHPSHKNMIDKNLLYTAITRFKQNSVIISDADTLNFAVSRSKGSERRTNLHEILAKSSAKDKIE